MGKATNLATELKKGIEVELCSTKEWYSVKIGDEYFTAVRSDETGAPIGWEVYDKHGEVVVGENAQKVVDIAEKRID